MQSARTAERERGLLSINVISATGLPQVTKTMFHSATLQRSLNALPRTQPGSRPGGGSGKRSPPYPYVKLSVVDTRKKEVVAVLKTSVVKGSCAPVWNERFQVRIDDAGPDLPLVLNAEVLHKKRTRSYPLGAVTITLGGLLEDEASAAFALKQSVLSTADDEGGGELDLSLSYVSEVHVAKHSVRTSLADFFPKDEKSESPRDDELLDPAIFDTYPFDKPLHDDSVIFDDTESGMLVPSSASIVRTIELITAPQVVVGTTRMARFDVESLRTTVLSVYEIFARPAEFLRLLLLRLNGPLPRHGDVEDEQLETFAKHKEAIYEGVRTCLNEWLADGVALSHYKFLAEALVRALRDRQLGDPEAPLVREMSEALAQRRKKSAKLTSLSRGATVVAKSNTSPLVELSARDLAEQWTLVELSMLRKVLPGELLCQRWNKHPKAARHMTVYIEWFNQRSYWVATEIVRQETAEKRAVVVGRAIELAGRFSQMNNYGALMEILSALQNACIARLKQTWAAVPRDLKIQFESLNSLMSPLHNFRRYRNAISSCGHPYIPYVGVHLTDLTFIDESTQTVAAGLLNMNKLEMSARVINPLMEAVGSSYDYRPMVSVQHILSTAEVFEPAVLDKVSRLREERVEGASAPGIFKSYLDAFSSPFTHKMKNAQRSMMADANAVWSFDSELSSLSSRGELVKLKQGDAIAFQGDAVHHFWMVMKGEVVSTRGDYAVALYGEGETIGAVGLAMQVYCLPATIKAAIDGTEIRKINYAVLLDALAKDEPLATQFFEGLARHLSDLLRSLNASATTEIPHDVERALFPSEEWNEAEEEVLSSFPDVPVGEPLLKSWSIHWKHETGLLFLTKNFVCLRCKVYMSVSQRAIPIEKIISYKRRKMTVELQLKKKGSSKGASRSSSRESTPRGIWRPSVSGDTRIAFDFLSEADLDTFLTMLGPSKAREHRSSRSSSISLSNSASARTSRRPSRSTSGTAASGSTPAILKHMLVESPMPGRLVVNLPGGVRIELTTDERVSLGPLLGGWTQDDEVTQETLSHSKQGSHPLRQCLTSADWERLLDAAKHKTYHRGQSIVHRGEPTKALYYIAAGECNVVSGGGRVLAVLPTGELFGESSFILSSGAGEQYTPQVSVVAAEEGVECSELPGSVIEILFEVHPGFSGRFYRYMSSLVLTRIMTALETTREARRSQRSSQDVSEEAGARTASDSQLPMATLFNSPANLARQVLLRLGSDEVHRAVAGRGKEEADVSSLLSARRSSVINSHAMRGPFATGNARRGSLPPPVPPEFFARSSVTQPNRKTPPRRSVVESLAGDDEPVLGVSSDEESDSSTGEEEAAAHPAVSSLALGSVK